MITEINTGLTEPISIIRFAAHFLWVLLLLLPLLLLELNSLAASLSSSRLGLCGQLEARRRHDESFKAGSHHFRCVCFNELLILTCAGPH